MNALSQPQRTIQTQDTQTEHNICTFIEFISTVITAYLLYCFLTIVTSYQNKLKGIGQIFMSNVKSLLVTALETVPLSQEDSQNIQANNT